MTYKILAGVDRDNTINHDEKAYFGSEDNWKAELKFCSGAIEGLRKLSENPDIAIAVLTSQVGIAKGVLTIEQVEEVNETMDRLLREQGVNVDSWQYSPFVNRKGAKRWEERDITTLNYDFVLEEGDEKLNLLKPQDGLLRRAAKELNIEYDSVQKYVLGDRSSDALCGINSGGVGILVNNPSVGRGTSSFYKTDKIETMVNDPEYDGRIYIVSDLIEAARIILEGK
ncbi:HAD-IIIA family hydrolase [Candidatus Woesearchaeota archaeon]|jgi:D-glycero-D-manno-heptose 1,7-bisphosphate phosphatase|nr:HAD-IIIA family hydrolase [Candidatus Woesearchaeota archaeon]MBT7368176.1 HAD-IIIA family hydrolase [Candidatus Woesearchaeota archaeon]